MRLLFAAVMAVTIFTLGRLSVRGASLPIIAASRHTDTSATSDAGLSCKQLSQFLPGSWQR